DEQDGAAVGDGLLDELVRTVDVLQGLLQVDDVDAVALGEDEALHLRVPAPGLVPEVHAALEELAHGDDGHGSSFLVWASPHVRARDQARADSVDVLGGPYRRCPCLVRTIRGTGTRCRTSPRDPGAGPRSCARDVRWAPEGTPPAVHMVPDGAGTTAGQVGLGRVCPLCRSACCLSVHSPLPPRE